MQLELLQLQLELAQLQSFSNLSCPPAFNLSAQTSSAFAFTLRSQEIVINELFENDYEFQNDPVEQSFQHYRQIRGDRFLTVLREVINSERKVESCNILQLMINTLITSLRFGAARLLTTV